MPVATGIEQEDGTLQWLLISHPRGQRVRLRRLGSGLPDEWVSPRRLRQLTDAVAPGDSRVWVVGQPALTCEGPNRQPDHGHGRGGGQHPETSPIHRYWSLMIPERRDLWVILVFAMIDGLVFLTFAAALQALSTYVVEILQRRLFVRTVADLAYRLPRVRGEALDQAHGPELVNRFFEIASVQKVTSGLLLDAVSIVLRTFIGMAVLAFYHPFLLGFDLVLLALIALITFVLARGAIKTAIRESRAKFSLGEWMQEPLSGHVELDGIDLRELRPDSLREHLAVTRSIEIFHGSIDENVRLNRPHLTAHDVREAFHAVRVTDEILELPDGLNAELQTNGSPLTATQALRLMLARAIVGRPRLLLIDCTVWVR